MYRLCILLLTLLSAAASADTDVVLQGDEILYNGPLTREANSKVSKLYEAAESKPTVLAITSAGGPVDVGLQLGEWILSKGLNVKVEEFCFSSCANYVFPAGKTKLLGGSAVVGFHGGAFSKDYNRSQIEEVLSSIPQEDREAVREQIRVSLEKYLSENREREAEFYRKLGVSPKLNILGQDSKYSAYHTAGYNGWYYSPDDMSKLGLKDIVIIGGEWKPETWTGEYRLFRAVVGAPTPKTD
ncbi:MAG TPA: hypothetical protein VF268_16345 [Gammaproteobacteria bacterium]